MGRNQKVALLLVLAGLAASCAPAGGGVETIPEPRTDAPTPDEAVVDPGRPKGKPKALIGVILPQSGSPVLKRYADLVLEGVRLAVAQHPDSIELLVLDDGGEAARSARLVAELERRGAVAIIGPLLPPGIAAAAAARLDSTVAMISPTAAEVPRRANIYSLNSGDTQGAEALAAYAVAAGLRQVGLLYPQTPESWGQAIVFRRALERAGGTVVAEVPYDSGTTTFSGPLGMLVEAKPQAVFVPAPEQDVRQLAPQISYYGLTGVQVLGGAGWTSEEVRRQVEPQYLEGVVATTPLYKPSRELGWQDFVTLYERSYRRSLANPFPALGYDAASLVLAARPGDGDADDLSERLASLGMLRGATGVLMVRDGQVVRRPFLVRIENGELVPVVSGRGGR